MAGGGNGIPLDKCFAMQERNDGNILNYIKEIL